MVYMWRPDYPDQRPIALYGPRFRYLVGLRARGWEDMDYEEYEAWLVQHGPDRDPAA
jgi:hypothetical protein